MTTHDPIGAVYKLHDGNDPLGLLGVMLQEPVSQTNAGRMSATVTISTQDVDRSGDIVVTKGIRLAGHQKNPIVLLNHQRELGVGLTADRLGAYTVKSHPDRLIGEIFFHQNTQLGLDTFRAVEGGVLRGVSIGFLPVGGKVEKRSERGTIYHEANLVEISAVCIPDNENAIVEAVHKTFGTKPPCPELAPYLPSLDYRPAFVRGGWDDVIGKAGTYKTAGPKEVEPLTRSAVYYVCPHCDKEMSPENIHKDEDGKTRHGDCRGEVTFKQPGPAINDAQYGPPVGTTPAVPKSLPRYLPGLRRKAMPPPARDDEYDDFGPAGGAGTEGADAEFLPDDGAGDSGLKAGAEFLHLVNDLLMQLMAAIEDGKATVDNATAMKTGEKVSAFASRALAALHAGHGKYREEHPDQPELPGAEGAGGGEGEADDEDDDLDLDDGESDDEADDVDDESGAAGAKPKKKKGKPFGDKEQKAAAAWRVKALNAYWEDVKSQAVTGDGPVVRDAVETLLAVARDKAVTRSARVAANEVRKSLAGLLAPQEPAKASPATDDEMNAYLAGSA